MIRRPTTRAELTLMGLDPNITLMGTAETEALRAALANLAKKLPQADPGPPQPGDPGFVTNQMISALASVASRIPKMPSEVKFALGAISVGIPLLEMSAQGRAIITATRQTITRFGSQLSGVINAYVNYLSATGGGGAGGSVTAFPDGSITTFDSKSARWRVAAPKDVGLSGLGCGPGSPDGVRGGCIVDDLGAVQIDPSLIEPGSYEESGTSTTQPSGVTVVSNDDYKKATSTPFYKAWWFWTPIGFVVGGVVIYVLWPKKRRRR